MAGHPQLKGIWSMKKQALTDLYEDLVKEPVNSEWGVLEIRESLREWGRTNMLGADTDPRLKGLQGMKKADLRARGFQLGLSWSEHTTRGKMILDIRSAVAHETPSKGNTKLNFGVHKNRLYSEVWIQERAYCEWVIAERETAHPDDQCSAGFLKFYKWLKEADAQDKNSWKPTSSGSSSAAGGKAPLRRSPSLRRRRPETDEDSPEMLKVEPKPDDKK